MAISFNKLDTVDNRPVYENYNAVSGQYNKLFEDAEGKFILFPNGYYSNAPNTYLVFQDVHPSASKEQLMLVSRSGTPLPIVWPLRPARSSVSITINGDA